MINQNQIQALIYLIASSKELSLFAQQILVFLIKKSENLSKEVCFTLRQDESGCSAQVIDDVAHNLSVATSCNYPLKFNELLILTGTELKFSYHYGHFEGNEFLTTGQLAGVPRQCVGGTDVEDAIKEGQSLRYTFWFAKKAYSNSKDLVRENATFAELSAIDPKALGLYADLWPKEEAIKTT